MPNMNQVMKMAQNLSKQMEEQMDAIEVEGNAGGGMVKVTMNGHKNVLSLTITPEVVDPDDIEMLQDLITAAVNDAMSKVDEKMKENGAGFPGIPGMPGMPGGFPFPGM
ncbi:MAG: YbaB/EbfC family nucleoid-associated protein [Candidatus Aminicenantes bacterium]|nr:YbaB/EbfC family nucleoid-associated protein [Candidatus Aminicenantes bacterium]